MVSPIYVIQAQREHQMRRIFCINHKYLNVHQPFLNTICWQHLSCYFFVFVFFMLLYFCLFLGTNGADCRHLRCWLREKFGESFPKFVTRIWSEPTPMVTFLQTANLCCSVISGHENWDFSRCSCLTVDERRKMHFVTHIFITDNNTKFDPFEEVMTFGISRGVPTYRGEGAGWE